MTPIFKNVNVSLDDIVVPHRRLLIGSYFGKKIGSSTPLLKWYLNHGLVITHIYTVMKYIPNAAFNSFMTQVTHSSKI